MAKNGIMTADEIIAIVSELYPKDRAFLTTDYDESLGILKQYLDLEILEYPSGSTHWKWTIPDAYSVREAYVEDMSTGKRVVDVADHPLHLACHSASFEGEVSHAELAEKICCSDVLPDAIPYHYKYQYRPWDRDWTFCMSKNRFEALDRNARYRVKVDTVFEPGSMKVGRFVKPGRSRDTILLVSHLDHPGQANDGLLGVVLELALMQALLDMDTHYTYEFLIVPEFLGSAAYLSGLDSYDHYKMGLFTEMLSTGLPLQLQKSNLGDTYIDNVASMLFGDRLPESEIVPYLRAICNDEVVFESPGVEIPFISISRARKDGVLYPEYHTSFDDERLLDSKQVAESHDLIWELLMTLEQDCFPMRKFEGFLCLSTPELDLYANRDDFAESGIDISEEVMQGFIDFQLGGFRFLDGKHRVSEIAARYGLPFAMLRHYLERMEQKGLVSLNMEASRG